MKLAKEIKVYHMLVRTDSKLLASKIKGDFQTKDTLLLKYLQWALQLANGFTKFKVTPIPREENTRAYLLARLANKKGRGLNRTLIQETLETSSIKVDEVMVMENEKGWMTPIIQYLTHDKLPNEETEAWRIKRISSRYLRVADQLYKMDRSSPMLRCVTEEEARLIMKEVHEGLCRSHIRGRALSGKILRVGYYWSSMLQDCARFVNRCEKYQMYSYFIHSLAEMLH